jgi:membrane-bound acyltransferase YfiQ involved in biofilm formation
MKLIISTILGFIVLFLLGWLFYGILFMDYFAEEYKYIARSMESFRWWSLIVANLIQALLISIIYSKFFNKGGSPLIQGITCGFWLGLVMTLPHVFYNFASYTIPNGITALVDGIIAGFCALVATVVIALVYGKPGAVKETITA